MRFNPRDFIFVRANAVKIGAIGPREQIRRLKKVHVRVDVTRQNEFADATDLFPEGCSVLFAHRNALNLVAVDDNSRVGQHFAVSRINHSRTDEGNFFRAERSG
jgi:hypothetical protein